MEVESIRPWNGHWDTRRVSELALKHPDERTAVEEMTEAMLHPWQEMWTHWPGPRQIGKTSSMAHVMQRLLDRPVPRHSIVFIPADQDAVGGERLAKIIESCMALHAPSAEAPLFLFLDEVQSLPDWGRQLKTAWDRYHHTVRVMSTGSNALAVPNADFLGRIATKKLQTMSFFEVTHGHPDRLSHASAAAWEQIAAAAKTVRGALEAVGGARQDGFRAPPQGEAGDAPGDGFGTALEKLHGRIVAHGVDRFMAAVWREYCVWGGYPAVRPGCQLSGASRLDYLDAAWHNICARDVDGIMKTNEFRAFFLQIARRPGGKFVAASTAGKIGVKALTISTWKKTLEDLALIRQLPPLKPQMTPDRGRDKAYCIDPAWTAYANTTTDHRRVDDASLGPLVEGVLVDHLMRLQPRGAGFVSNPGVDVAINLGPRWMLVEAKYRAQPSSRIARVGGADALRIIATRDHFRVHDIYHVPAHELAYAC